MKEQIINIVGPSGSGKTSLVERFLSEEINCSRIVTDTTRTIRQNEIDGLNYYFKGKEEFIQQVENNEFVEYSAYNGGDLYGMRKKEVEEKFKLYDTLIAITDINGAKALKRIYGDSVIMIFIMIEEADVYKRLQLRGETDKKIAERTLNLKEEMSNYKYADYIIYNKDFDNAYYQLKSIIQRIK